MWEVVLYRAPVWVAAIVILAVFVGFAWGGLLVTRRWLRNLDDSHNELAGYIYAVLGVIYGVILGLTALATWERFNEVSWAVENEAASAVDLERVFEAFPLPDRDRLRTELYQYVVLVVTDEWPALRHGRDSAATNEASGKLARDLGRFEPRTSGQEALFARALDELDDLMAQRQFRMHAGQEGLHGALWWVLLVGGFLTIAFAFGFRARDHRVHGVFIAGLAAIIGLVIFWVFVVDHPMWGSVSISSDAFTGALREIESGGPLIRTLNQQ